MPTCGERALVNLISFKVCTGHSLLSDVESNGGGGARPFLRNLDKQKNQFLYIMTVLILGSNSCGSQKFLFTKTIFLPNH